MPFNKTTIQDKELSIQIFKGGFSFCTPNARPFFKFDAHSIVEGDAFRKLLESHSFLESKKIKGVHFDHSATFVPKTLYNPKQKHTYLNYNVSLQETHSIAEKESKDERIKVLYPVDVAIEKTLQHYFKEIHFTHYSQILYDLSSNTNNADDSIVMNLHMQDDQFDLLVFKGKELLLFNTYPYKNEDGFLYFVLAVAEELSLSPEAFEMVFFGKYVRYKKCYEALSLYHEKITFADQEGFVMFDEREHPAPYFINLFD
jgi:hypothetical protein